MSRFYEPVAATGGLFSNHFAVRGKGGHHNRILGADMRMTWDQADRLCDLLEQVRQYALNEGVAA